LKRQKIKVTLFFLTGRVCGIAEEGIGKLMVYSLKNTKLYLLILLIPLSFISCEIDNGNEINIGNMTSNTTKIYSGSYGYNIAYRIADNKVYSGSYGYDTAYRIDGNKIYSGSYGYDVAFRIDGSKIYSGSYGYDVAFRIDGDKIYSGSFGYDVAYRIDR